MAGSLTDTRLDTRNPSSELVNSQAVETGVSTSVERDLPKISFSLPLRRGSFEKTHIRRPAQGFTTTVRNTESIVETHGSGESKFLLIHWREMTWLLRQDSNLQPSVNSRTVYHNFITIPANDYRRAFETSRPTSRSSLETMAEACRSRTDPRQRKAVGHWF